MVRLIFKFKNVKKASESEVVKAIESNECVTIEDWTVTDDSIEMSTYFLPYEVPDTDSLYEFEDYIEEKTGAKSLSRSYTKPPDGYKKPLELPTKEQIEAGNKVAEEMIDASVRDTLSEITEVPDDEYEFSEIVQMYLDKKIDSVTGIWLAMQGAE